MGRFKHLIDSPAGMEGFRAKYYIPWGVALRYCTPNQIVTDRKEGEVVIPMIAFIEGGMTLPMGRVTRDYLINHSLTPHQCVPNLFRVLGSVDALNEQMGLRLTWRDIVHMYKCHKLSDARYYLKSWSNIVRLILCLPKSNKGMKDDYLIFWGMTQRSSLPNSGGRSRWGTLDLGPLTWDFAPLALASFLSNTLFYFNDGFH